MQTLSQLEQEKEKRKSTPAMIGERIGKRLASVRVNYTIFVVVICWSAFALFIYFLRLLEFNLKAPARAISALFYLPISR